MFFDLAHKLPRGLFKACVIPRPIAWISTVSQSGVDNLAPFSYFNIVADEPPMVMFSTTEAHIETGEKDTLRNAEETGEFVVNITSYALREEMNITSMNFTRHTSEFSVAAIEQAPAELVRPKRIKAAPISLECRYYMSVQLPRANQEKLINRMVLGHVVGIHVCESVLDEEQRIDPNRFRPLARLGYQSYTAVQDSFEMQRPELASIFESS
ncbi:Flavin reductase like domain protein [Legionella birminghamensis]|uniref:Flavin reductase like domain n=1 Tax=Legionella birminghamensis TaxID=28083 RepID=A0A378I7T4_9GAMM|nr:flavin reductase family protein [Legionella birminghamensis]KTC71556.1 Flavin reductase like domain protein [Legionella birminghamensis]STX30836.1 Flavin reductase like domain [Legionella birminghamensis]